MSEFADLLREFEPLLAEKVEAVLSTLDAPRRAEAEGELAQMAAAGATSTTAMALMLNDLSQPVAARVAASWWLGRLGDSTTSPSLLELLRRGESEALSFEAAKALAALGVAGVQDKLLEALIGRAPEVARRAAAWALGSSRGWAAVPALRQVLDDLQETSALRGQAAESLGGLMANDAVSTLIANLQDGAPEVRFWCVYALGAIRSREAIPSLTQLAANDHVKVPGWWEISREATSALESIAEGWKE